MALYFANYSGAHVRMAFIWGTSTCGPFAPFMKGGWWQLQNGASYEVWPIDLLTAPPVAAFYGEGGGNIYGPIPPHSPPHAYISNGGFRQCMDDLTGCDLVAGFGVLSLNTGSNAAVYLRPEVPEQPNWWFESW